MTLTVSAPQRAAIPAPLVEPGWGRVLVTAASRGLLGLVGSLVLWSVLPVVWGWTPQVIMTGSMAPTLASGDVVVTRPVPVATLRPHQVITVSDPDHPGRTRTHRFVRLDRHDRLVTRGDANPRPDSTHVDPDAVRGVAVLRVPYIARVELWVSAHDYPPLAISLAVLVLALLGARSGRPPRRPRSGRREGRRAPSRRRRCLRAAATGTAVALATTIGGPADAAFVPSTSNPTASLAAATTFHAYQKAVLADSPYLYWRLQETTGTTVADKSGNARSGTITNTAVLGAATPISGDPADTAFGTGTNAYLTTTASTAATPSTFSVEAWVKSTSIAGGRIIGYGNAAAGSNATKTDCQLYLAPTGKVELGLSNTSKIAIASTAAVNDGLWHHIVGTYSSSTGAKLYVDGTLSASGTGAAPVSFAGYWRAGAEALTGWPANPTSNNLAGTIDEVAVYTTVLSATRITAHYQAATS
jgi:signal peptidase I